MTGSVMKKVNDELLDDLKTQANTLHDGMESGHYPDMQSIVKAQAKLDCLMARVLVVVAGEGVVSTEECKTYRKAHGSWAKVGTAAVYCAAALGALVALLQLLKG